jgi:hypothetical protein
MARLLAFPSAGGSVVIWIAALEVTTAGVTCPIRSAAGRAADTVVASCRGLLRYECVKKLAAATSGTGAAVA